MKESKKWGSLTVTVDREFSEQVRSLAQRDGVSLGVVMKKALHLYIEHRKNETAPPPPELERLIKIETWLKRLFFTQTKDIGLCRSELGHVNKLAEAELQALGYKTKPPSS